MAKKKVEKKIEEVDETQKEDEAVRLLKAIIPYIVILVVVVLIRTFIITPIMVKGTSMKPTYDGGEVMLLYKLAKYDRFDVVIVKIEDEKIIKRVIALPGETISCENGVIYVNDRKQEDDYSMGRTPDFEKIKLADDEFFVLGDNRANSLDSSELGPFKKEKILGRPVFTMWPFKKIGTIKK